jgi:hypothetical protein
MRQRRDDGIQNLIEALANILAQKPQHMISVLPGEPGAAFSPGALDQPGAEHPCADHVVRLGNSQVLTTIQFDCYLGFCAQQVHLHSAPSRRKESAILH